MSSSTYQLPNICCKCGENYASQLRPVHKSQLSGFGYYFLFMTVKRNYYSFNVPVCLECSDKLEQSDNFSKLARVAMSILVSFVFLYIFAVSGYLLVGGAVSVMVYIVMHLAYSNHPVVTKGLGGYNGQYFWFSNFNYFKRFAEMNPKLVSPFDYNRLFPQSGSSDGQVSGAKSGFVWSKSNIILTITVVLCVLCISVFFCGPLASVFIR